MYIHPFQAICDQLIKELNYRQITDNFLSFETRHKLAKEKVDRLQFIEM